MQENLSKKIRKLCTDETYFKDVVANLKKYAKKSYFFEKYDIKEQVFDNISSYSNHKISNLSFDFCCRPKRGDEIVGFINSSNVVIHNKLCHKAEKLLNEKKAMVFVKWNSKSSKNYKIIFTLDNKKGALAEFLTSLSRMQANLISINLSDSNTNNDFFFVNIEFPENAKINLIKERLLSTYKIIEFASLNDAYNQ